MKRAALVLALSLAAQSAHAGDLAKYLGTLAAHGAVQYATDVASTASALRRPGNVEANRLGPIGAVAADSVAFGTADFLAGKIHNKAARLVVQNLVRVGAVGFGLSKMRHNQGVGR